MKRPAAEGLSVTDAAQAGVSARAVRYYVARGVLPTPKFRGPRTRYDREHVVRLFAVLAMRKERLDLDAIRRRLTTLTSEELEAYMPSSAAGPAAGATLVPPSPASYAGASWEHVALLPAVELHIRSDASPAIRKLVQEIVDHCVGARSPSSGPHLFRDGEGRSPRGIHGVRPGDAREELGGNLGLAPHRGARVAQAGVDGAPGSPSLPATRAARR